jgi:hypothetical protein
VRARLRWGFGVARNEVIKDDPEQSERFTEAAQALGAIQPDDASIRIERVLRATRTAPEPKVGPLKYRFLPRVLA